MLFHTLPEFESPFPRCPGLERYTCWSIVEIPSALPWYVLHLERELDEDPADVSYLISSTSQLTHTLNTLPAGHKVLGLHLLLPAGYAKSSSWVVKPLVKVWRAHAPVKDDLFCVSILELADGEEIFDPPYEGDPKQVLKKELLLDLDKPDPGTL